MEVAAGIHRIDAPLGDRLCAMYLLVGTERAILIDTGVAGNVEAYVLPYLASIGVEPGRVRLILISHSDVDHSGDTEAALSAFPGALLTCHRADAAEINDVEVIISQRYGQFATDHGISDPPEATQWVRNAVRSVPVHLELTGDERLRLAPGWAVEILHTPGHSLGHVTVWDPRCRAAIILDAALGRTVPTADGKPAFPPTYRYVGPYRETLAKIEALEFEYLLASHEPVMDRAAGQAFLAASRAFTDEANAAILALLRAEGPLSTRDVLTKVGPELGPWPLETTLSALAFPLVGHLEHLEAIDQIHSIRGRDGLMIWQATK